jgi:hypothetical protein
MRLIKINGVLVDFDKVENPNLKKVLRVRCKEFMFSYGDSSHSENCAQHKGPNTGYSEESHKEHADHTDKSYREYGDYSESSTHTDVTRPSQTSDNVHTDYTDHTDNTSHSDTYADVYSDYHYDHTI